MTVRELIEALEKLPEDDKIYFNTTIPVCNSKHECDTCFVYEEDKEDNGEKYDRPAGSVIIVGHN